MGMGEVSGLCVWTEYIGGIEWMRGWEAAWVYAE